MVHATDKRCEHTFTDYTKIFDPYVSSINGVIVAQELFVFIFMYVMRLVYAGSKVEG